MTKVSIVIPIFNRANFIDSIFRSISRLSYHNFEVIFIDDGSTDDTIGLLQKRSEKADNIILLCRKSEPKGAQSCRNIGIKKSTGKYIVFLDSDDYLASFSIAQRVKVMVDNENLDFAVFPQLIFKENPGDSLILINVSSPQDDLTRFLKLTRGTDVPWINNSTIWKAKSVINYNLTWDENLLGYQDIDFHIQALLRGLKYQKIESDPDCFWRQHSGNRIGSNNFSSSRLKSHEYLFYKICSSLKQKGELNLERIDLMKNNFFKLLENYVYMNEYDNAFSLILKMKEIKIMDPGEYRMANIYITVNKNFSPINWLRRPINFILRKSAYPFIFKKNEDCNFLKHNHIGTIRI